MGESEMKRKALGLIPFLGLLLSACRPYANQCGIQYNSERQRVGLPIIPSDWRPQAVRGSECTWINPDEEEKFSRHLPVHSTKYVQFQGDTIIMEIDTYYGPGDYTSINGTFRERLYITYYYQLDKNKSRWDVSLWNQESFRSSPKFTLEEADQILRKWGIDRLTDSPILP